MKVEWLRFTRRSSWIVDLAGDEISTNETIEVIGNLMLSENDADTSRVLKKMYLQATIQPSVEIFVSNNVKVDVTNFRVIDVSRNGRSFQFTAINVKLFGKGLKPADDKTKETLKLHDTNQ